MDHSKGAVPYFVLEGIASSSRHSTSLPVLAVVLAVEGQRGAFFVEDAINGCLVGLSESVPILGFSVQFG